MLCFRVNNCNLQLHKHRMIAKLTLFAFTIAAFASCAENEQTSDPGQTYNKLTIDTSVAKKTISDSALLKSLLQPQIDPRGLTGVPEQATQNYSTGGQGNSVARLNPAHGQPGHRCEIAVGAPLDSKPVPTNNPTQIQAPVTATQVQPATTATPVTQQVVAAGMNPAHGQPNHRCDIAVGAPLNSKPASANANPVAVNAPAPAATNKATPVQMVAPGMNPAHGQPNHRCDIAVGAPLNSKPAAPAISPVLPAPAKVDSTKQ